MSEKNWHADANGKCHAGCEAFRRDPGYYPADASVVGGYCGAMGEAVIHHAGFVCPVETLRAALLATLAARVEALEAAMHGPAIAPPGARMDGHWWHRLYANGAWRVQCARCGLVPESFNGEKCPAAERDAESPPAPPAPVPKPEWKHLDEIERQLRDYIAAVEADARVARMHEREANERTAKAERERDEAIRKGAEQAHRLATECATALRERDKARSDLSRVRETLRDLVNARVCAGGGQHLPTTFLTVLENTDADLFRRAVAELPADLAARARKEAGE